MGSALVFNILVLVALCSYNFRGILSFLNIACSSLNSFSLSRSEEKVPFSFLKTTFTEYRSKLQTHLQNFEDILPRHPLPSFLQLLFSISLAGFKKFAVITLRIQCLSETTMWCLMLTYRNDFVHLVFCFQISNGRLR